ncbi:MAG: TetR/AcrR family transcriptional regulator [Hyphomonadaceae bacterium]
MPHSPARSTASGARRAGMRPLQRARPGRPPKNGDVALRERILDVAEEQFAKRGYEGVSTRAVARDAAATPAMIHYYFNSKRKLFDAVFARRADVVNKERMAALDAYEASAGNNITVEGAIAAFLRPVLNKLDTGGAGWRNYLALVAQVGNLHEWGGAVMTQSFDPIIQRLISIIRKALPDTQDEELYWAYHFLSGALMLTLAETDRIDRLSKGKCRSTDIAAIEPRLVQFASAGFRQMCNQQKGTQAKKRKP